MRFLSVRSRRGAYIALIALTVIWSANWLMMKLALERAPPVSYNIQRTMLAMVVLFAVLLAQRRPFWPGSWLAVVVTGFFQTTVNFGSTTMALAEGGVGRTSVLVFTMPFWTMLLAWPVLHERVRGIQWVAVLLALLGLGLVVEPWNWHEALRPKMWAVLSGFGWAAGSVATKYFERTRKLDMINFIAWQMAVGVLPFFLIPIFYPLPATQWSVTYALLLLHTAAISTALGFLLWIGVLRWLPAGTAAINMLAIPVIALLASMLFFGERLDALEWTGIACIGVGLAIVSLHAWWTARARPRQGGGDRGRRGQLQRVANAGRTCVRAGL